MEFGESDKESFRRCAKGLVLLVAGESFVHRVAGPTSEWSAELSVYICEEINIQTFDHRNMLSLLQHLHLLIEIDILQGMWETD